jgi:hypothetical protein
MKQYVSEPLHLLAPWLAIKNKIPAQRFERIFWHLNLQKPDFK